MRQTLAFLIGIILISSCSEVRFSAPQPLDGKELDSFPIQFIGRYIGSEGDTLFVNSDSFCFADDELKCLSSDRVVLKQKGGLYIISCKEVLMGEDKMERRGWEILPFELINDSLVVYFLNTTNEKCSQETITKLNRILPVEEVLNDENKLEYYYIAPTIKQFEAILNSQCFTIADKFVRTN